MLEVVDSAAGLERFSASWRAIERSSQIRVFQTYDWCFHAWTDYLDNGQNRLWTLKWSQDGQKAVVFFPFFIDAGGTLRFIMDQHSDLCDCVCAGDFNYHLCAKEVVEAILSNDAIRRVWLQKMSGEGTALNYLGMMLPAPIVSRDNTYSWIRVHPAEDFAASQPQLRSKDKANVRAIRRKAERFELRVLSAGNGDPFPRDELVVLREKMLEGTNRKVSFFDDRLLSFSRHIYEAGRCEIVQLQGEGRTVAMNFLLRKDDRRLSWIFLYDDPHASTEMYVKYLYQYGAREDFVFDFGVGGYDYKLGTFRPELGITFSLRFAKTRWLYLLCAKDAALRCAKDYVKFLIGRGHR